jgi:acyl-CoA reductase-like NAD-dependent aldehyde dehydrogenase
VIPYPERVVGLSIKLANGMSILIVPSNETPAIVLAVCSLVADATLSVVNAKVFQAPKFVGLLIDCLK